MTNNLVIKKEHPTNTYCHVYVIYYSFIDVFPDILFNWVGFETRSGERDYMSQQPFIDGPEIYV